RRHHRRHRTSGRGARRARTAPGPAQKSAARRAADSLTRLCDTAPRSPFAAPSSLRQKAPSVQTAPRLARRLFDTAPRSPFAAPSSLRQKAPSVQTAPRLARRLGGLVNELENHARELFAFVFLQEVPPVGNRDVRLSLRARNEILNHHLASARDW